MSTNPAAKAPTPPPPAVPDDLLAEGARARKLSGELEGVKCMAEGMRMINNTILTHVLLALWDSGFYEYSLTHPRFSAAEAAEKLNLDAEVLLSLLHYLVGCGVLNAVEGQFELTEYGSRLSNVVMRGVLNINLGGYGAQLKKIGPLLRKEVTRTEIDKFHSTAHSGLGTEELTSVRLVPAVQKILAERNLHSMLHLACGAVRIPGADGPLRSGVSWHRHRQVAGEDRRFGGEDPPLWPGIAHSRDAGGDWRRAATA